MAIAFTKRSWVLVASVFAACSSVARVAKKPRAPNQVGVQGRVVRACDGEPFPDVLTAVFAGVEGRVLGSATSASDGTFFVPLPQNQRGTLYFAQANGAVRLFDGQTVEQGSEVVVLVPCPRNEKR